MIISAIIPTYEREQLLARAVSSVLSQDVPGAEVEVIVVNDSGEPLGCAEWQNDPRVSVFTTHHTERCVARNTGAALSRGDHLHFLDDDDVLLPGAYAALLDAARATSGVWTYGGYETVDDEGKHIETIRPVVRGKVFALAVAGATIPMGASLIERRAFFGAGGFDPAQLAEEDSDLLQRVALRGNLEVTNCVVARFRVGTEGPTTTDWARVPELGRMKREKAFAMPCCLRELGTSLDELHYGGVRGRLVRFYWGSAVRHVRDGTPIIAASRFGAGLRLFFWGLPSRGFWRGLRGGW